MAIIETKDLTKYYGKSKGIENINIKIEEGEIFGFIGPNGAGKSTMIRTLLNLIYPTKGSATIFGLDIIKDTKKIKRNIGFIPSEVNYYNNMTIIELLKYSSKFYNTVYTNRIDELSEIFQMELNKKILDLSLGNKKKVSILQSLIHKPKLLILDEPTNGLDPLMQSRFFEVLKEENKQGTTIFFSSHILTEVQNFCKKVAIIREGNIINIEDIETLRKKQLKKVKINFLQDIGKDIINIEGIVSPEISNNKFKFLFSGDINKLIEILAKVNIDDLIIEEPTLEEIFMHYYENI